MLPGIGIFDRLVAGWAVGAARRPRVVVTIMACFCVLCGYFAATGLSVNTDTRRMLSAELDFQKWTHALDEAFPMLEGGIVVVVRGQVEEDVDRAVVELVDALERRPVALSDVFAPTADPFLQTHGLLFGSREEIRETLMAQADSSTLIDNLAETPTLDALFQALLGAVEAASARGAPTSDLDPLMNELASVMDSTIDGVPKSLSWLKVAGQQSETGTADGQPVQKLVFVQPVLDFTALQPAGAALAAIDTAILELPAAVAERVEIGVTGEPALRTQELASVAGGIEVSFAISLVLVSVLLLAAFLSVTRGLLALSALLTALLITSGMAGIFIGDLNLVSVAFTVLLVGLGLDFAIHFLAHLDDGGGHGTVPDAIAETCHNLGAPLAISAVTTAFAFLSFVPTDFVGMGQLGIIGAIGVIAAFFVAITLLPALLALFPSQLLTARRPHPPAHSGPPRPNTVHFSLAILLLLGTAAVVPRALEAHFETDPMALRDPASPAMRVVDWLIEVPSSSPYRISAVASSADTAAAIKARFSASTEVDSITWLGDFVADDQDAKLELIAQARAIPSGAETLYGPPIMSVPRPRPENLIPQESEPDLDEDEAPQDASSRLIRALAQADLTLASGTLQVALERYRAELTVALQEEIQENVFRYLPDLVRLREMQADIGPYTAEDLPPELIARYRSAEGQYRIDIAPSGDMRNEAAIKRFVAAVDTPGVITAGGASEVLRSGETVSAAMVTASSIALALVCGISLLLLRSLMLTLAIIIPLFVGAILTAAASATFNLPFNYANVIVLPLLIGLGVDSGIHLAMRGDRLRAGEAIFATSTPRAIVFSALTTIAAFGALSLNDHRGTASMGLMLAMALTCTIISVLVLTPPLVHLANTLRGKHAE